MTNYQLNTLLMWCLLPLSMFAQTDSLHQLRLQEYVRNIYTFNRLYPQEKVWLHCDNTAYFQGDTIWFAAYVTSAETLRPAEDLSKVLYVELLNEVGEVLSTQRLQIENGRCHGQIILSSELEREFINDRQQSTFYPINPRTGNYCIPFPSGYYEVRAYTRAMLNWGTDICFSRVFPVFDTPEYEGDYSVLTMKNRERQVIERFRPKTKKEDRLNVDFFPEGGNIVTGLPCRVAYKVTDKEGRNLHAQCKLMMDGKPITRTDTAHDGMGCFSFLPQEGKNYKLHVEADGLERTFNLPKAQSQGLILTVDATGADSVRMIVAATEPYQHSSIGMSITCRGKLSHFQIYDRLPHRPWPILTLHKDSLPAGVNQVTLFDANGQVFAERLFFVHDTTVVGKEVVEYQLDKEEYKPFEEITLTLQSRRGGAASLSVRDGNTEIGTSYRDNLQTYLLLTSDLKGYIHRPDYYFEVDDSVHRTALDLLMMTQGWRRYAWKQLAGVDKFDTPHFIEEGLMLQGQVKHPGRKDKFLKDIHVGVVISDGNKVEQSGHCITDENGYFSFKIEPFEGRHRLSLNIADEWEQLVDGKMLLHRHFSPSPREYGFMEKEILSVPKPPQVVVDSFSITGANLLNDVQVGRNRQRSEPFILHNIKEEWEKAVDTDDRYFMSGRVESYIYDRYVFHEEIIWSRVWNPKQYEFQEFATNNDFGEFNDRKAIHHTNLYYVDYILVYTDKLAHTRIRWENGALESRMDKLGPMQVISSWIFRKPKPVKGLRTTHIDGFSEVIDYYHPQYNREIIPGEVDYRRTLYWNPYLELDNEGKSTITFYNNDTYTQPLIQIESLGN